MMQASAVWLLSKTMKVKLCKWLHVDADTDKWYRRSTVYDQEEI